MRIYISHEHLKIIHYYYFSMGVLSFYCFVAFPVFPLYSLLFLILYISNSIISWYIGWVVYKQMKRFVIVSPRFWLSHLFITLIAAGLISIIYLSEITGITDLMNTVLFINLYVVFLGVMWYVISKIGLTRKFFILLSFAKERGIKRKVLSLRKKFKPPFRLVTDEYIKSYEFGKDPDIDSLFYSITDQRSDVKKLLHELELRLCMHFLNDIKKALKLARERGDFKAAKVYERMIKRYETDMIRYEKLVEKSN